MKINGFGSSLRVGAFALVAVGSVTAAQAGFFETLFGTEAQPEQPRYYQPEPQAEPISPRGYVRPLDFTVRKRVVKERAVRRERVEERRETRRVRPAATPVQTAEVPAGPIDPAQNKDWYLQDPTLRAGDIVVLTNEVLVFKGGRMPFARENFASLSESDLPKDERERLAHMAGLKPVAPPRTTVASASQ